MKLRRGGVFNLTAKLAAAARGAFRIEEKLWFMAANCRDR